MTPTPSFLGSRSYPSFPDPVAPSFLGGSSQLSRYQLPGSSSLGSDLAVRVLTHTQTDWTIAITSTADAGGNENPRKTQKADITRKVAFWATKVALKASFLGVEKMGLTTSLYYFQCAPLVLLGPSRRGGDFLVFKVSCSPSSSSPSPSSCN